MASLRSDANKRQADEYILPDLRSGAGALVSHAEHRIADVAVDSSVGLMDENGNIVGTMDGVIMEFF